jgi:2-octaprenyl-6-methoxyphenol hydroxylase
VTVEHDVAVVGAGPAGLAAACLLSQDGMKVALVAPPAGNDSRTVALMQPTLRLLEYIAVWPGVLQTSSAPLRRQRIIDDTGSLFQGPALAFSARDMGLDAFAWNIPLQSLIEALRERAAALGVRIMPQRCIGSQTSPECVTIMLEDSSSASARFCIAADGATSTLRQHAGIGTTEWRFDQSALVTTFSHSAPHDDTSTEYHKRGGPCTVVPLPGNRCALVWMMPPEAASRLLQYSAGEFLAELQAATHGDLGRLSGLGPRSAFPMKGLTANRFAAGRTLLVGEAAHVVPPIGAQGLNMSFRDVGMAADLLLVDSDGDPSHLAADYDKRRQREVVPRQQMISLVNKSLLLDLLPLDAARAAALWTVHGLEPLRKSVMSLGLGLSGQLPFAMRERPVSGSCAAGSH